MRRCANPDGLQERYPELYEAGQAAVEQFEDAFGNGTDALIALCNSLGIEIPASLADALGDESIWNSASDALNTGMEQITGAVGDFMETAGKADMGRYGSGAEQGTEGAKNSVIASMNTTTDPENFTTAADNAQTTGESIGAGVSDGVSGKETDITTAVQGLVASMNATFEPTVQSFGNTARMAMTNVSIGIQAMQGNAVLSARNAGNAVVNAMRGSLNGSTGYSLGNDLMRGIISGINSMAGMLSSAARTVVRNAVAAMRKAADAHSPSRETLALGRDMDAGGAIGLSGGMMAAAATQAVKDTIRAMTAQTRDFLESGIIRNSVNLPAVDVAPVSKPRLFCIHENVPNVLGSITSAVAGFGLNISDLVNRSRGSIAVSVVDLDEAPSEKRETLTQAVKNIAGMKRVRLLGV